MRIGIFGGSFNPVHIGHLIAAECCREQGRLERVILVPAAIPPHKQGHELADASHRVAMLNLAVGGHGAFAVSTVEIDRGGVSYTVDTLDALARQHPHDELVLVLGPDALAQLPTWRKPQTIAERCEVLAVERESLDDLATLAHDAGLASLLGRERLEKIIAARVRMPAIGIRASDLRAATAAGRSIRYRTPRAVEAYIATHSLYRGV